MLRRTEDVVPDEDKSRQLVDMGFEKASAEYLLHSI